MFVAYHWNLTSNSESWIFPLNSSYVKIKNDVRLVARGGNIPFMSLGGPK